MKTCAFIIILSFILTGCEVDRMTHITATLYNNAGVKVTFTPYKGGIPDSDKMFELNSGDTILIAEGNELGNWPVEGFSSDYISGMDSIVITFKDSFPVTHYTNTVIEPANKSYQPDNPRNILIGSNYEFTRVKKKKEYTNVHKYYFTESDYEFARD